MLPKSTSTSADDLPFLKGGGEMGGLMRARDWSNSSLGAPETWPQALRMAVRLILNCAHPMYIFWGAEGVCFYNDAYSQSIGPERHPGSLGCPAREVWEEIWPIIGPQVDQVMAGEGATWHENALVPITRNGKREDVYWTYTYSPIDDETAPKGVGGVLVVCTETTKAVLAERRAKLEGERFSQLFDQAPTFMAVLRGPQHRFEYANPAYYKLIGHREVIGLTVEEALPDAAAQGYTRVLDLVFSTGEAYVGQASKFAVQSIPGGPSNERFVDFVYQPTRDLQGKVDGIFVQGVDVTERTIGAGRDAALAELGDRIRDTDDPDDLAYAAAEILGRALEVSRAGYGTINKATETIHIERDWNMPGVNSLAGTLHFRDYGSYIEELKNGITVVIEDANKDPRTAETAAALKGISAQSFVNMPVTEQGGFVALLYLNHATPHVWTSEELTFIREVADRTRTAIERRRAEAELRESERRYRALFNAIDEGFCIIEFIDGPDGPMSDYIHVEANAAYAVHAGIPDVVGKRLREIVGSEADEWFEMYRGVLRTGESIRFERKLEETGRWLELAAFRIEPAGRKQVAVIFQDLTAKKEAELALRDSEQKFRTLTKSMPNQAWTSPPDGLLDWFNEQVYAFSGAAPGSLDGEGWASLVHPDDLPEAEKKWAAALHSGETYEAEFRLRRADGTYRWHIARAAPIKDAAGQVTRWIGTNTDIQEQKQAAEMLSDLAATLEQRVEERTSQLMVAEESLRQSHKMEAVGQLTGGIAHDFNNLLGAISGSLEMLEKRLAQGKHEALERYISTAQEASRRAASLTQRLLAFSRRQTLDPKPVDANRLIGGVEDLIRRTVGPMIEVEVVGAGGLWTTRIDPPQLENALLNLCINARDAMAPDGGRLTIETANKWFDERGARERELPAGQYVSICVTDTGAGMTPEVVARAFDPFFTTKPIGQGTGLGLSMIYGFVRQSGGQVRIYSEIGKGTTMCLYLPRYFGKAEDPDTGLQNDSIDLGEGETVLVIDDEPILRMLVTDVLQEHGYRSLEAIDGPSGLKILESDMRVDLLITDVGLPGGMNGRQVADAARKTRPDLKVLFITGYAENAVIGNGHLDHGMEVLTKPFPISTLGHRIRQMIEK